MRRFVDDHGIEWTVALGRASYGEMTLLFSARGNDAVYVVALEAATSAEGQDLLASLEVVDLRRRLAGAELWDPGWA